MGEDQLIALVEQVFGAGALGGIVTLGIVVLRKVGPWIDQAQEWIENLEKRLDRIEQAVSGQEDEDQE